MTAHNYSNLAVSTTLVSGISDSATSLVVSSASGYPAVPFFVDIGLGTAAYEVAEVTFVSGTTFTVVRGYGDTTAVAHSASAVVRHIAPAEFYATAADLATAQVFTNKTMSGAANTFTDLPLTAVGPATGGVIYVPATAASGTAINAAFAALPATGGRVVLLAGTHTLDVAVQFDRNDILIEGVGGAGGPTIVEWNPNTFSTAFKMADTTRRRIHMRHMFIRPVSGVTSLGTAIDMGYFTVSTIEKIIIGQSTRAPLIGIDMIQVGGYYNMIRDCLIQVNGTGAIGIRIGSDCNSNGMHNVKVGSYSTTNSIGIKFEGTAHSQHLSRLDIEGGSSTGFVAIDIGASNHMINIVGSYFEADDVGLRIAAGAKAVTAVGCDFHAMVTANFQDSGCEGLSVIGCWVDYLPYSRINGVRPVANTWAPDDSPALAVNYDPVVAASSSAPVNGTNYLMRVNIRERVTVNNILVGVNAAGVGPVAGQSFAGIYDSAGTRVAVTADIGATLAGTGLKTLPLTAAYVMAPGKYWVAVLSNAATPPTLVRGSGATGAPFNLTTTASNLRFATNGTVLTALPASVTPGSNVASGLSFWVGLT